VSINPDCFNALIIKGKVKLHWKMCTFLRQHKKKERVLRKQVWPAWKIAASLLLKLFIYVNEICHWRPLPPLAQERTSKSQINLQPMFQDKQNNIITQWCRTGRYFKADTQTWERWLSLYLVNKTNETTSNSK